MTKFLASVSSAEETKIALAAGVDIIDLKDPQAGALGAVSLDVLRQAIKSVQKARPVSAAIGDLPLQEQALAEAVKARAALGVDYVKIAIPHQKGRLEAIKSLAPLTRLGAKIIAVFFADEHFCPSLLEATHSAAFSGVMFDTNNKTGGSLTKHRSLAELKAFLSEANHLGLITGLAGSLSKSDIPTLLPLRPDTLGFRGALCEEGARTGKVNAKACSQIRELIPNEPQPIYQTTPAPLNVMANR